MNPRPTPNRRRRYLGLPLLLLPGATALAHSPSHGGHGSGHAKPQAAAPEQQAWGMAGRRDRVTRTVRIDMDDRMRFTPSHLDVTEGETLRLQVHNKGRVMHELVIGTRQALDKHARLMEKHLGMEHDEPHMAHVSPGRRGELLWHFNRAGDFEFACLIPGHYSAGMRGTLRVAPRQPGARS